MTGRENYYPYFDYLRAAAAIGVFASHADSGHLLPEQFGNACVQVFFALSGFLIGGILLRSKREDLPRFYFNRATRIWIPYALAIALLAAVTFIKQGFHDPKFGEFFFYMGTFVYNWFGPPQLVSSVHHMPLDGTGNHFWSICVEEQFYLVAPFLILYFHRTALLAAMAAVSWLSPGYFASISAGLLLAIVGPRMLFLTVAIIVACAGIWLRSYEVAMPPVAVALVCLLAWRQSKPTSVGKIVGGASYSFYLNHWIGLFSMNFAARFLSGPLPTAIGLTVAATIGTTHYLVIDRSIATRRGAFFSRSTGYALCLVGFLLVVCGLVGGLYYYPSR